jgi:S-formylglutathione hydrolase FrmB
MKLSGSCRWLSAIVLALFFGLSVLAQKTELKPSTAARVQEHKLDSKLMERAMPYRVILPADYEKQAKKRYPVIYLLHGLTGHFNNWTDRTKIAEYAAGYDLIVVTPEGGDGWYTDSVTKANDRYESYIISELVSEVEKKFRARTDRGGRLIAGLSMGGYGALKFGLKYPDKFALAGSFSGALGAATLGESGGGGFLPKSIGEVFGSPGSETRKANDIFRLVREMPAEKIRELPFIYFDCGTEDFLFSNNRDFAALLLEKKVKHEFRQLPGAHNWTFWDSQAWEFLRLSARFFTQK